ncbi:MAG: transcription termination/antitermination protein NusG [Desulfohalobiaceae bacterium]
MEMENNENLPRARWYIIQTLSGYEQRVEKSLQEMIRKDKVEGLIQEAIVPTEKVVEMVKGQKKTTTRKFYPGYVLVKMVLTDKSWHIIQSLPRVTGFIGDKEKPVPLRDAEAEQLLQTIQARKEQPRPKFSFQPGDKVQVVDGPFANFDAYVEEVNQDKGKLKVSVSIFGRNTPVELDFVQVTKSQ